MPQPIVVHLDEAVATREDQVDEVMLGARLSQPMAEHQLAADPVGRQRFLDSDPVRATHEEVQVLRVTDESGMVFEGIGSANQIRDAGFAEMPQHRPVDIGRAGVVGRVQQGLGHSRTNAKAVPWAARRLR